ncbi:hypothetical protein CUP1553 [Campylobacter upsaliensis RM3195]|nr:hypothetical protein CUP1553 [Campylobacter upsaliensis RM3195]
MIGLKKNFLIAHLYYAKLHFSQYKITIVPNLSIFIV